jgi:hypothetical protein
LVMVFACEDATAIFCPERGPNFGS